HRGCSPATRAFIVCELDYRDSCVRGAGPGLVVDRDLDEWRIRYFQKGLHLRSLAKLIGIGARSLGLDLTQEMFFDLLSYLIERPGEPFLVVLIERLYFVLGHLSHLRIDLGFKQRRRSLRLFVGRLLEEDVVYSGIELFLAQFVDLLLNAVDKRRDRFLNIAGGYALRIDSCQHPSAICLARR